MEAGHGEWSGGSADLSQAATPAWPLDGGYGAADLWLTAVR